MQDLLVHPDSTYLTNMLGRTKGNLGKQTRHQCTAAIAQGQAA